MIDPNTGLWVDQISHTPGPGGNPMMGGLMDAYNAMQGSNLYNKKESNDLIERLMKANQDPEFYQNLGNTPQGMSALQTLNVHPDTLENITNESETHKYHEGLKAFSPEELTPQNLLYTAAQNKPEEMVKMYPQVRAQLVEEGKMTRERETQQSKQEQKFSDEYGKLFKTLITNGIDMDRADEIAMSRAGAFAVGVPQEKIELAKERAKKSAQLEQGIAPAVQAKMDLQGSMANLADVKADDIKALEPAKKAALWATAHSREAAAAYAQVHRLLASKMVGSHDITESAKAVATLAQIVKNSESSTGGLADPLVQRDPQQMEILKGLVADAKPLLDQAFKKLQSSLGNKAGYTKLGADGKLYSSPDGQTWTPLAP